MGTIPLDAALAAHEQAARDLRDAIDHATAAERVCDRLAMTIALRAMRYVEKHGVTEAGRKQLRTGIEAARSVLGAEAADGD